MEPAERKVSNLYAFAGVELFKNSSSILHRGQRQSNFVTHDEKWRMIKTKKGKKKA